LADTLKKLGIPNAFSDRANFAGITKKETLQIDKVIQKAFIEVHL
jgi:serine protease inhibitor